MAPRSWAISLDASRLRFAKHNARRRRPPSLAIMIHDAIAAECSAAPQPAPATSSSSYSPFGGGPLAAACPAAPPCESPGKGALDSDARESPMPQDLGPRRALLEREVCDVRCSVHKRHQRRARAACEDRRGGPGARARARAPGVRVQSSSAQADADEYRHGLSPSVAGAPGRSTPRARCGSARHAERPGRHGCRGLRGTACQRTQTERARK